MATIMLQSESSTDPSKPFKIRFHELRVLFNAILTQVANVLEDTDKNPKATADMTDVLKSLNDFNSACDEIVKEVHRRKQKQLNLDEGSLMPHDMQHQVQTVGNLTQVLGDFRRYLETGEISFTSLKDFKASHLPMKSPGPMKSPF